MYEKKTEEQFLNTPVVDKQPTVAAKSSTASGHLSNSMIGIGNGKDYLGIKAQPKYMVLFGTGIPSSLSCVRDSVVCRQDQEDQHVWLDLREDLHHHDRENL